MTEIGESPEGYGEYVEYISPEQWLYVLVLALTIGLGEFFFPGVIGWLINGVRQLPNLLLVSVEELLFILGLYAIHEWIHYIVALKLGYSPKAGLRFFETIFGIKEPSPYIVVLNEHISRNHNILMLIAPLVVIDAISLIGLLPIFPAYIPYFAKIALIVNSASSMQDVYNVVRRWTMDEGTQFINVMQDDLRSYYCEPHS